MLVKGPLHNLRGRALVNATLQTVLLFFIRGIILNKRSRTYLTKSIVGNSRSTLRLRMDRFARRLTRIEWRRRDSTFLI